MGSGDVLKSERSCCEGRGKHLLGTWITDEMCDLNWVLWNIFAQLVHGTGAASLVRIFRQEPHYLLEDVSGSDDCVVLDLRGLLYYCPECCEGGSTAFFKYWENSMLCKPYWTRRGVRHLETALARFLLARALVAIKFIGQLLSSSSVFIRSFCHHYFSTRRKGATVLKFWLYAWVIKRRWSMEKNPSPDPPFISHYAIIQGEMGLFLTSTERLFISKWISPENDRCWLKLVSGASLLLLRGYMDISPAVGHVRKCPHSDF